MDYKKIIPSRKMRLALLSMLSFIPDKAMLKFQYRLKMGRKLNIQNPQRFTEKLQWYKLYYKNPEMIRCVDKNDVRTYIQEKKLEDILIPSYGVFDQVEDVDWNAFPNQFVMKDTLGGGGTSVVIVRDKDSENIERLKEIAWGWIKTNVNRRGQGREWPYYNGKKHRILFEEYIDSDYKNGGLIDYKFFCFGGKVEFIYVMGNRKVGESVSVTIVDKEFNKLPVRRVGDRLMENIVKPDGFDEMCRIAEVLASDFPHVRVDLYNQGGRILFGELTFYNASGYMIYDPDSFDYEMGKKFVLETYGKGEKHA